MTRLTGVLLLTAIAAAVAVPAAPARAAFTDAQCSEAVQYVTALGALHAAPPLGSTPGGASAQAVADAAHAAAAAYDTCAKRHLSNANVEPGVHYAYTREAGFAMLEARALLAAGRTADARAAAETSRRLAQDVADWRQSYAQGGSNIASTGSDTRPSVYRDAAREIVASANDFLAKVPAAGTAAPVVAPPSPSPHR
jgi:hypothetical protein